jgi:hypothetical protein
MLFRVFLSISSWAELTLLYNLRCYAEIAAEELDRVESFAAAEASVANAREIVRGTRKG